MIELKRFIRPGIIISVIGHLGFLVLGLFFVGASSFKPAPQDAMVVDIVPPKEAPRFQGTPSTLRSSGTETQSKSNPGNAATQSPPPKPAAQSPQPPQQHPEKAQHKAVEATPLEAAHGEAVTPEKAEEKSSEAPPDPAETTDQSATAEMVAELALLGGPLGGGFNAPAIPTVQAAYDFTAPFRERVSSCSALPPGIDPGEDISVKLRVFFNPDGTLASPPRMIGPVQSWKQQVLMDTATNALQRCQPYTMLLSENYKRWKTLELVIFPLNFLGR
jgi:hypothetical protein